MSSSAKPGASNDTATFVDKENSSVKLSYEDLRKANIARNKEQLAALGFQLEKRKLPPVAAKKSSTKKRRALKICKATEPLRVSRRLRGVPCDPVLKGEQTDSTPESPVDEEPEVFEESAVKRYVLQSSPLVKTESPALSVDFPTFRSYSNKEFVDNSLKRSYDMSFHPIYPLLGAGGHDGRVAIFGIEDPDKDGDDIEPMISFRAHRGWVANLNWELSTSRKNILATAANDGNVKLWDVNQVTDKTMTPKEILCSSDLHSKGIFSMQISHSFLLTASKDGSVVHSQVSESEIKPLHEFTYHDGVVKSAAFRLSDPGSSKTIASCGNDRQLCVKDLRERSSDKASVSLSTLASSCLNHVEWHPTNTSLLIISGFDAPIWLYDIRKTASPLFTYTGHHHPQKRTIYHPHFFNSGDSIVTIGGGTDELSIYSVNDGSTLSRGELDFNPTSIGLEKSCGSTKVAVSSGKRISIFQYDDLHSPSHHTT